MKKKILIFITKGNFGGAQKYVFDLATNLDKEKFESIVVCGDGEILPNLLQAEGIKTIHINGLEREVSPKSDFDTFKKVTAIIQEEKPDIVHFNSSKMVILGSFALFLLNLQSLYKNIKIPRAIFTAHNWAFNERRRSAFSKLIFYISHYLTVAICDETIAVSQKTKDDADWMLFLTDKIKVIHNGTTPPKLISKKDARKFLGEEAGQNDDQKLIIFSISELNDNKGIDLALKAIGFLPEKYRSNLLYSVAGNGEDREKLELLAKNIGIEENIKFLGFVEDASTYLSGADIFLMPSRNEAFPYSILEAGMSGIPIISTSVGGIPEVIKDMQNGILIHAQNVKELEKALIYGFEHKEKMKEFGKEIKETVENLFPLKEMVQKTAEVYTI